MSGNQQHAEVCVVINDKSQSSVVVCLSCVRPLNITSLQIHW